MIQIIRNAEGDIVSGTFCSFNGKVDTSIPVCIVNQLTVYILFAVKTGFNMNTLELNDLVYKVDNVVMNLLEPEPSWWNQELVQLEELNNLPNLPPTPLGFDWYHGFLVTNTDSINNHLLDLTSLNPNVKLIGYENESIIQKPQGFKACLSRMHSKLIELEPPQ